MLDETNVWMLDKKKTKLMDDKKKGLVQHACSVIDCLHFRHVASSSSPAHRR